MPACHCSSSQFPVSGQPYLRMGPVPYSAQSQIPPAPLQQPGYQTVMPNQQQNYQNMMQPPQNQMQGMMVQHPSVPSYQLLRGVPASSRSGADAVPPHHGSLRLATDSRAAVLRSSAPSSRWTGVTCVPAASLLQLRSLTLSEAQRRLRSAANTMTSRVWSSVVWIRPALILQKQ